MKLLVLLAAVLVFGEALGSKCTLRRTKNKNGSYSCRNYSNGRTVCEVTCNGQKQGKYTCLKNGTFSPALPYCVEQPGSATKCKRNEVFSTCASPCNTCDIAISSGQCNFLVCNEGCDCKPGYHRNNKGTCVTLAKCLKGACKKNEKYNKCGTACPETCQTYGTTQICTDNCVPGCFCKKGYVKNDEGVCVKPTQCPAKTTCGKNEEYTNCGTACPKTCKTSDENRFCTMQCVTGCFCKEGYVRNDEGVCVDPTQCPNKDMCGQNEEMSNCAVPAFCKKCNKEVQCKIKCTTGCDCIKGYVRDDNDLCIPKEQCPETCGKNEVMSDCAVPPQCKKCNQKFQCSIVCQKGCDCIQGYVRDANNRCIPKEQCPADTSSDATCGLNEEMSNCARPPKCNSCNQLIKCKILCKEGCDCIPGYVRDADDQCIPKDQCPATTKRDTASDGLCKPDEEYYEYTPSCKMNCHAYFNPGIRCAAGPPGCFCKKDLVKRDDGACVPPEQCPSESVHQCRFDEQYYEECMPTCQNTCLLQTSPGKYACRMPCRPGCFCREGLLKADDGSCVPLEQCPRGDDQQDDGWHQDGPAANSS